MSADVIDLGKLRAARQAEKVDMPGWLVEAPTWYKALASLTIASRNLIDALAGPGIEPSLIESACQTLMDATTAGAMFIEEEAMRLEFEWDRDHTNDDTEDTTTDDT